MLRPFINFYGGKWRAAPHYPAPLYPRITESFAGGAGYSTRYHEHSVVLVESDPTIAGLWRWLIKATEAEVLALPLEILTTVRDLGLAPGPSALIGFWLNKGGAEPKQSPSAWMRDDRYKDQFWGATIRARIASQVGAIRHWTIIEGDFTEAPDEEVTDFVDPPYANKAGSHYRHRFNRHAELAGWCRARRGQVIVCENEGATWLPFEPLGMFKANESAHGGKRSAEVVWRSDLPTWDEWLEREAVSA